MNCLVDVIIDIWYIDDDVISQKVWIKANKKNGYFYQFFEHETLSASLLQHPFLYDTQNNIKNNVYEDGMEQKLMIFSCLWEITGICQFIWRPKATKIEWCCKSYIFL